MEEKLPNRSKEKTGGDRETVTEEKEKGKRKGKKEKV